MRTVQREPAVADAVALLPEVGRLRLALARERHAINLDLPAQEVEHDGAGWQLVARAPLPVEGWNAEISLLTGMCAAQLMLDHRHGILRTVPPPPQETIRALRRAAVALGIDWPQGTAPGDILARLDRTDPQAHRAHRARDGLVAGRGVHRRGRRGCRPSGRTPGSAHRTPM